MSLVLWVLFGIVNGVFSFMASPNSVKGGMKGSILFAIVGALIGGVIGSLLFRVGILSFHLNSFIVAAVASMLAVLVQHFFFKQSGYIKTNIQNITDNPVS